MNKQQQQHDITDNMMNMATKMMEDMAKNPEKEIDVTSIVNGLTSGLPIDDKTREKFNGLSNTLFTTLNAIKASQELDKNDYKNTSASSKIMIEEEKEEQKEQKEQKDQKEQKNYREPVPNERPYVLLDNNEHVDEIRPRTRSIKIKLDVSLEELYNGVSKKIAITRKRFKKDQQGQLHLVEERKKLLVNIEKGSADEQYIVYNKQGDEAPGHETGDIIVILQQNQHPLFERQGDNLFISKKISLYESYAATFGLLHICIPTLDGRVIKVTNCSVPHENDGFKKIKNEGMPCYKKEGHGDLFIKFHLVLPEVTKINTEYVTHLKQFFPPINRDFLPSSQKVDSNIHFTECHLLDITEEDYEEINNDDDDDSSDSSGSSDDSDDDEVDDLD